MKENAPPDLPILRFIPFRQEDIVTMCRSEGRLSLTEADKFSAAGERIEDFFQRDFFRIKQQLKRAYGPLDPDADTRVLPGSGQAVSPSDMAGILETLLYRANYEKVTAAEMREALGSSSLFNVQVEVNLDDFEEVLLFTRGASLREETVRKFFGLWRRPVRFINFERVLLYLRLKADTKAQSALDTCQPGSTLLKLFQNVPETDLEMLFPNIRVTMRMQDRLLIGIPAVISGGLVVTTKLGTTLLLLASLFGFWLGWTAEPVELDKTSALVLLTGAGALVAYLWKQFSKYRNRKLRYTQALTEQLYFKLLDNNAGVLYRVLEDAQESESKECLLAYYCLLAAGRSLAPDELDALIEQWFERKWQCKLDFDVGDALAKLQELGLARCDDGNWRAAAS